MREFKGIPIYDDIKELNNKRFNEFTKYVIQAHNVNGSSSSVIANLNSAIAQSSKDVKKVIKLIENAFISLEYFKANINIYALAFVVLTEKDHNNLDLDYLNEKLFHIYLKGINADDLEREVKQSEAFIQMQFKRYSFSERSTATITAKLVKRVLAKYDYMFKPKKREEAIKTLNEANNYFLDRQQVKNFNPNAKGEETNIIDSSYERNNIALQRLLNAKDLEKLTVYQYYCLLDEAKKLSK